MKTTRSDTPPTKNRSRRKRKRGTFSPSTYSFHPFPNQEKKFENLLRRSRMERSDLLRRLFDVGYAVLTAEDNDHFPARNGAQTTSSENLLTLEKRLDNFDQSLKSTLSYHEHSIIEGAARAFDKSTLPIIEVLERVLDRHGTLLADFTLKQDAAGDVPSRDLQLIRIMNGFDGLIRHQTAYFEDVFNMKIADRLQVWKEMTEKQYLDDEAEVKDKT